MNAVLNIQDISVALPRGADRSYAVEEVSLQVRPGEIVCVVGESGSGKSTLAHAVLGLLPRELRVAKGEIFLGAEKLTHRTLAALRRIRGKRISMIFQEPLSALNPLMKCGVQVIETLKEHTDLSDEAMRQRVKELFISVGLGDYERIAESYPFQLSGGQRQRVMIAMALALEPEILIADEPTTALDVTTQAQILALIKQIQLAKKIGVLFITHDFGVVSEIADRVVVMKDGQVVEEGTRQEILESPKQPYTKSLLEAVPSSVPPKPIGSDSGKALLLKVKGLQKTYVKRRGMFRKPQLFKAVQGVDFKIYKGETVGLVGESGSGKTTIGRIIAGLLQANGGSAQIDGIELCSTNAFEDKALRRKVQMIFQDPFGSLNPRHRVSTILTAGMIAQGIPKQEALARAQYLLDVVQLDKSAMERFPHEFSGGQRQRLGFARAIALNPELIIADEPVSALDVSVQKQVLELLRELKENFSLSMLFITHDLRVAAQLCERVLVLQHGKIVEQGKTADVLLSPQHPYTQALIDAMPGKEWK